MISPRTYSILLTFAAYFLCAQLLLSTSVSADVPHRISLVRRNEDFDSLLSELKSKGSRMRFGKRSGPTAQEIEADFAGSNYYMPDRYIFLQSRK